MEEKRGDNNNGEERRGSERLTIYENRTYTRRPLTQRSTEYSSSTNPRSRRSATLSIVDDGHYHHHHQQQQQQQYHPKLSIYSETQSSSRMKSSSPHYTSNPSLIDQSESEASPLTYIPDDLNNESTYSFRRELNKLRTAKSHGELYQPHAPFPLPLLTNPTVSDPNESKSRSKVSAESAGSFSSNRSRPHITTMSTIQPPPPSMNASEEPTPPSTSSSSSSHKLPIWKRFKNIITPTKRNKHPSNSIPSVESTQGKHSSPKVPPLALNELSMNENNRTIPDGTTNVNHPLLQNPIKLSELRTWLTSKSFPEQRIRDEYEKLPTESLHPKTLAFRPENRSKNRFNAIEPYDHSRVVLRRLASDPSSDYINASYIDGYRGSKVYIAAQAPTETTLQDFIRMIWQLRIQSIIMVTRLFEDGKHKCIQYWPDEGEKRVNDFRIRLENEEKYGDYTIRRLALYNPNESTEVLIVKHYHFLSWPDHGCLSLSTPLLDFRQRFRSDHRSTAPILVHCSAGVGRSGTFIALDALLETAEHQDTIDVLEFTHRMRQNRVYMIQTAEQYVFLYRTLIEGILTIDTYLSLQEFLTTRKLRMDAKNQYRLLEQLQGNSDFSYRSALDPVNISKNRSEMILAPDNSRPYLMTQVEKTTDYINAVFVNSYRQTPSYIVTQYPLPHTCIDLWRLVYDHNVSIIMLLETIPRDPKNVPYWNPNIGQICTFGPFEVLMTSQKEDDCLIERVFDLKSTSKNVYNADRTRIIRQFQMKDSVDRLVIIKRFLKEMRTYSDQNVILQCLNGVTWSGYFAALCNSIDKMQTEQIVDPFKIVRLLRSVRPEFIDQNQYENLFQQMYDYAQRYLLSSLSQRLTENSTSIPTSTGHDQSSIDNRVVQRS